MLSESPHVLDALADLLEATVERHFHRDTINMNSSDLAGTLSLSPSATTSRSTEFNIHTVWTSQKARMTQTRYIMQVDEEAFRSSGITYSQLHQIECKELGLLLDVLANTVALQSFRLVDPPASNSGPRNPHVSLTTSNDESHHRDDSFDTAATRLHSCSRSFARIAAAICWGISTAGDLNAGGFNITNRSCSVIILSRPKMLDLLLKCASHPSVVVCATILPVMTPILAQQMGLATQWLPILQRRAIIPHHHTIDNNTGHTSTISLDATDLCQVQYDEFAQGFRDTVLSDALLACFQSHPEFYVASCTAAIEEFCSVGVAAGSDSVTVQTSFHLEAALFVMACASDAVSDSTGTSSSSSNNDVVVVLERISSYLERCTAALAKIPPSLTSNPLAMVAACRFIMKVGGTMNCCSLYVPNWLCIVSYRMLFYPIGCMIAHISSTFCCCFLSNPTYCIPSVWQVVLCQSTGRDTGCGIYHLPIYIQSMWINFSGPTDFGSHRTGLWSNTIWRGGKVHCVSTPS
jgi:hypothetical protein